MTLRHGYRRSSSGEQGFAWGRNLLLVVVLVLGLSWMSSYYNVWHEREVNRGVAAEMLPAAMSAQGAINKNIARTGSLVGSGKDIVIPPSKAGPGALARDVEWTVSKDGHILGRTTDTHQITVEWTPSIQGGSIVWTCKFTFPERRVPQSPPPCPEIR